VGDFEVAIGGGFWVAIRDHLPKLPRDWQIRQIAIYQEGFRMSTGENFKEVRGK
jgi:hypothetical protein